MTLKRLVYGGIVLDALVMAGLLVIGREVTVILCGTFLGFAIALLWPEDWA